MIATINKDALLQYITNKEVIYQEAYDLINISNASNHEDQEKLMTFVKDSEGELTFEKRESLFGTPYEDLSTWSNENDVLVLVGEQALLCIPKKDVTLLCK